MSRKDSVQAALLGETLCRLDDDPADRYNLACLYIRLGHCDKAMQKLRETLAAAPNDPSFLPGATFREDTDLDPVRKRPKFAALLRRAETVCWKPTRLEYESGDAKPTSFVRRGPENAYLTKLRTKYNLDALVVGARGDMERVKILCTWVHTR